MSTVEHTSPPQPAISWTGALRDKRVVPAQSAVDEAWREMPSEATAGPASSAEAAFGATRLVILTLVALVILAPVAPGLVLVALAAAILAPPYLLVRRLVGQR
jgi:Flp pilus assembly protein TadB